MSVGEYGYSIETTSPGLPVLILLCSALRGTNTVSTLSTWSPPPSTWACSSSTWSCRQSPVSSCNTWCYRSTSPPTSRSTRPSPCVSLRRTTTTPWCYRATSPPESRSTRPPPCAAWAWCGLTNNELQKMINGNKGGYNLGMWNCRKGLIDMKYEATSKFEEVKQFLIKRKLHMLCLIETDLDGTMSRNRRTVHSCPH